jgi:apolipoprotein N-acyltransferase
VSVSTASPRAGLSDPGPARRRAEAVGVSLLGGLVWWAAVTNAALGPLLAPAYVILMAPAVVQRWRAPLSGFLPGFWLAQIVLHWPLSRFGGFVPFVLPIVLTLHYPLQPIAAGLLRRVTSWPAVVIVPLAVGLGEWLRPLLGVGSFNMYMIGPFLYEWPVLTQLAEIVGAPGLSVLWVLPWAFLLDLARLRLDGAERVGRPTLRWGPLAAATALLLVVGYGLVRLPTVSMEPGPRVAVVQPSQDHQLPEEVRARTRDPRQLAQLYDQLVRQVFLVQQRLTNEHVPRGAADLIVWPENSVLVRLLEEAPAPRLYRENIRQLAASREAPLLLGTLGLSPEGRPTNTTLLMGTGEEPLGRYDKVVLFPFTERRVLPGLQRRWPALADAINGLVLKAWSTAPDGWAPAGPEVLTLPAGDGLSDLPFWTPVCYESCYGRLGRDARRQGARFFVNLTSEGWLGWAASNNMMAVNVLRAVENRVGLVRAGNTGPSGFILPSGRIDRYLRGFETGRLRLEPGVLVHRVALGSGEPTVYARFGGLFDALWPALWVLALVWGLAGTRRRRVLAPGAPARGQG